MPIGQHHLSLLHCGHRRGRQDPGAVGGEAAAQVHPGERQHIRSAGGDQPGRPEAAREGPRRRPLWYLPGPVDVTDRAAVQKGVLGQRHV
jgi:hypothetical protein